MQEIMNLLRRNLFEVFGERDQQLRQQRMAELWTGDCTLVDPEGVHYGQAAINEMIVGLQSQTPSFVFTETEPSYAHHDAGCLGWGFGPEGQAPQVKGVDFAIVRDSKIVTMYTFIQAQP